MVKVNIDAVDELDYLTNEAYRTLRTNIALYGSDIKAIAITSPTPKEGKTSVAFNLAKSMAKADKKVLFIDADLRKSSLIKRYKVREKVNGFDRFLSGEKAIDDVVYATNIENLDIVFSCAPCPNSSELLDSSYFKEVIPYLKERYDYIFIDTPSLGSVIDGAIIAQECDGVVVVIEENAVRRKKARQVMDQLEETDCKILGVVINKVQAFKGDNHYIKYYEDTVR